MSTTALEIAEENDMDEKFELQAHRQRHLCSAMKFKHMKNFFVLSYLFFLLAEFCLQLVISFLSYLMDSFKIQNQFWMP